MSMADNRAIIGVVGGSSTDRETEPDLDLIKEVEQVAASALERPAWRFAAIPGEGIADAVEVLVFLFWQLLHWLLFGCKNSRSGRGRSVCEGAVRQCCRPHPAVPRTGPHGPPSRC